MPRSIPRDEAWTLLTEWVAAGGGLYAKLVLMMRIPEARQIEALIMSRLRAPR